MITLGAAAPAPIAEELGVFGRVRNDDSRAAKASGGVRHKQHAAPHVTCRGQDREGREPSFAAKPAPQEGLQKTVLRSSELTTRTISADEK